MHFTTIYADAYSVYMKRAQPVFELCPLEWYGKKVTHLRLSCGGKGKTNALPLGMRNLLEEGAVPIARSW